MRILFPFHPAIVDDPRSQATSVRLTQADRVYPIESIACTTDTAYETALMTRWGTDDWCVWEHDMVPTLGMLADLEACPEPVCAQAYPLWWNVALADTFDRVSQDWLPTCDRQHPRYAAVAHQVLTMQQLNRSARRLHPQATTNRVPVCAHRVMEKETQRWCHPNEPWADAAGLGLTRFRRDWMADHPPSWTPGSWKDLDSRLSTWWQTWGQRVHVHWPLADHHHACPCHPDPGDAIIATRSKEFPITQPKEAEHGTLL